MRRPFSSADVVAQRGDVNTGSIPGLLRCLGGRLWYSSEDRLGTWANFPSSEELGTPQMTSGSTILVPILVTQSKSSLLLVDSPWLNLYLHFWKGYEILGLGMWILWQQGEQCSLSVDSQVWEPDHTLEMYASFHITGAVFPASTSELTLSLLLSICRLFKDSSTKQDLYCVLNLSAASVKQYKVLGKQLRIITWI